mmetsp:Transcript_20795/g.70480  ORF Transcript_20795/g.70480 Transcript_20795/m.70480 type:complete len:217 (+) Transcript_20795:424-1074(+)
MAKRSSFPCTPPGCTECATTPGSRAFSSRTKRMLHSLDQPYHWTLSYFWGSFSTSRVRSGAFGANQCASEEMATTTAGARPLAACSRRRGRRRRVNSKWPRWFVANCDSMPSAERTTSGGAMIPALRTTLSMPESFVSSRISSAALRVEVSERSSRTTQAAILTGISSHFSFDRAVTISLAPLRARTCARPRPRPDEAPVMSVVTPLKSSGSAASL